MRIRVMKFGGTSVGDPENIGRMLEVVRRRRAAPTVLVFSAMGQTTDVLVRAAGQASSGRLRPAVRTLASLSAYHRRLVAALLTGEARDAARDDCDEIFRELDAMAAGMAALRDFSPAVRDRFLGTGELLSTSILARFLAEAGIGAQLVDSRELVVTDGNHGAALPFMVPTRRRCRRAILPILMEGRVPVMQGFIARSCDGTITTLGRGGSDFTASLMGAALDAEEIEIWTDVDGIMTADPSMVPEAKSITSLSFDEAAELAFFGARVLHPKTLAPAVERGIPVRVLNTARPEHAGTAILGRATPGPFPVKSIAYKEGMTVVDLVSARMFKAHTFLGRVFEVMARHEVAPDLVATSEVSVAMALSPSPSLGALVRDLSGLGRVEVRRGQAVVAVVGERLKEEPGIVGRIFDSLTDVTVAMVSQGGSKVALSFAVAEEDIERVVKRLHRRFFEACGARPSRVPVARCAHG